MKILSRTDGIKKIFENHFPEEIVDEILENEKQMVVKEAILYHLSISPIYSGYTGNFFFTLKKYQQQLYPKNNTLMEHIRSINGSLEKVRKQIGERLWGKYLAGLRY
jgi:hypothetical protein